MSVPTSPSAPASGFPRPATAPRRRLVDLVLPGRAHTVATAAGEVDAVITGVTHDSHAARPGDLYLARPGERVHGARFAADAVRAGAVAVLTDAEGAALCAGLDVPVVVADGDLRALAGPVASWVFGNPSAALRLAGITGTNGKTTTAYLVEAALRAAGQVTGLIGTVETRVAGQTLRSVRTTPEATDLQALLAVMVERGVGAAAMEVSSHALALGRVDGVTYDVAVFTNLSQDHLDFHGDLESYFEAKALLFRPDHSRVAVVTVDDEHGRRLAERLRAEGRPAQTCTTGDGPADWRASEVVAGPAGSEFRLTGPDGVDLAARVALPGRFNVANAVAAVAAAVALGVDVRTAVDGVGGLAAVPGRMQRIDEGQPFTAIVDYAHTPEAVASVLASLREVTPGRLVVVLGAGGDRDRGKRPLMGAAAARGADVAVLTSDNPRSEDPLEILGAVVAGAREAAGAELVVEPDRRAAIEAAVALAGPGDTVVVAGRGHESAQEAGGQVQPFDDRAVLSEALRSGRAAQ